MFRNVIIAILGIGSKTEDDEDSNLRRRFLIVLTVFMSFGGLLWGAVCLAFKLHWAATIPFGYVFLSVLNMCYLRISKNFEVVQVAQIFLSLLLPFLFQLFMGGYHPSGGVIYWSILAVLGSFSLTDVKSTFFWIVSFILMVIASAFLHPLLSNHSYADIISSDLREVLFVFNLVSVSTITYLLVRYFVTEQLRAHQEVQLAQRGLIETSRLSALGEMAGGIAHEINNPLAIILGKIQKIQRTLAKRESDYKDLDSDFARTIETVERISSIVSGLKQLARDGSSDENCDISLKKILEDTLILFSEKFKAHDIKLTVEEIPQLVLFMKPGQMAQVLLNLLTNAYEAVFKMKEGWVKIQFEEMTNGTLRIKIIDSGPRIPPEISEKMMQPFFTTKEIGKGIGLGLSLSRQILISHGGALNYLANELHTCFALEIPIKKP